MSSRGIRRGLQTLGVVGDRVKKMSKRGYMAIKFGGMRNDLGFSQCLLLTGTKGVMKLILMFPRR